MRKGSVRLYLRGKTWWCWGYDANGVRWRESTHQADRKAAEVAARAIERKRADPAYAAAPKALPLEGVLQALRAEKVRAERAAATLELHDCKAGHLVRVLGRSYNVLTLTEERLTAYLDQRRQEGAGRHTVAKELGVLRGALRGAAAWNAGLWPRSLTRYYKPKDRWLSVPEYRALLGQVPALRRDHVIAYCHTGARFSELYTITAEGVDLARGLVRLQGTKTDGAYRWVPISADLEEVLRRRIVLHPTGPLFEPWQLSHMHSELKKHCRRAGIAGVSANDLRRTFCSWLCNAGVPEGQAAELLGHKGSLMVRRVYGRYAHATLSAAVARLPQVSSLLPEIALGLAGWFTWAGTPLECRVGEAAE